MEAGVQARRQAVRWLGRKHRQPTDEVLDHLRTALRDGDWEIRASAMLIAARMDAKAVRSLVNETVLPSPNQHGLDERDVRLLVAARYIAVEALDAPGGEARLSEVTRELVSVVLGGEPRQRDQTWLLIHALTEPAELDEPVPEQLPSGFGMRDGCPVLGGVAELAWVSRLRHVLGAEAPGAGSNLPIRDFTPADSFFIARRPLSAPILSELGIPAPAASEVADSTIAKRLANTPDAPVVVSYEDAVEICDALGRSIGTPVELPTADELECAARGTDGRRYSWGNGIERLNGMERSPHGLERFAVPIAQWTSSRASDGSPLVMGGPDSARCSVRRQGVGYFAVRPVVRVR